MTGFFKASAIFLGQFIIDILGYENLKKKIKTERFVSTEWMYVDGE